MINLTKTIQKMLLFKATLSASGISTRTASVPDSHEICLPVQDTNVLSGQTYFMAVRYEVRRVGYT